MQHLVAQNRFFVRLVDFDLNVAPGVIETATVTFSSSGGSVSGAQLLTETGADTGVFGLGYVGGTFSPSEVISVQFVDPTFPQDTCVDTAVIHPSDATVPSVAVSQRLISPADGSAVVGEAVSFRITVTNPSNVTLSTVTVTDTFPLANLSFDSASIAPDSVTADTLVWDNIGPVRPQDSLSILVNFTALASSALVPNTASVTGTASDGPATASVSITDPRIAVTKTLKAGSPNPASIGQQVTFQIRVENSGSTDIASLPLTDYFGGCLEFASATIPPDSAGGNIMVWNDLGALSVGDHIDIETTFNVVGECDPVTNSAVVALAVDVNGDRVPIAEGSAAVTTQGASIGDLIWRDLDGDGFKDSHEGGISGVIVYLDLNSNGVRDADEPFDTSDDEGLYRISESVSRWL